MKRKILTSIALSSLLVSITSCEGYRTATGTVRDENNNPLDSVFVNVTSGSDNMYTDSTGEFKVRNRFSGCMPKCKDIHVDFSKDGYQHMSLKNPDDDVVVVLRKQ